MIYRSVDKLQLKNLLTGVTGIYFLYFIAGLLHESVIKNQFHSSSTGKQEKSSFALGMVVIPFLVAWICAFIYNRFAYQQRTHIPRINGIVCGCASAFTSILSMVAIMYTSFPVVVMFESCNVLSVVLVGVFCTRIVDNSLKLSRKKIVVAAVVTCGILLFEFSDSESKTRQAKSNLVGVVALAIWVVVEGFFPDLQAEIKTKYKPQPSEMMEIINKWASIAVLVVMLVTVRLYSFCVFMVDHPLFSLELFGASIFSAFGQFFVYRMIKHFKQHVLPFTITTRKLFTVLLSIVFFGHSTNWMQILGIFVVMLTVGVQFYFEISKPQEKQLEQESQNEDLQKSSEEVQTEIRFEQKASLQ